jgi:hypothetical protein
MRQLIIPPFSSLGLILSYQCSNECRHCLYACSPGWTDWIDDRTLERVTDQIARHTRFLTGVHLAGGEPFLRPETLLAAVRALAARGLPIDYVETNAFWCRKDPEVKSAFQTLQAAGLPAVLVSASPFHAEFVPLDRVKRAIRAGRAVFGQAGVHVYTDYFLHELGAADSRYPLPFEDYIEIAGLEKAAFDIADRYGVVPNGRAPLELSVLYERKPASAFFEGDCSAELTSPHHAHIDLYGNTVVGLCAGISVGDGFDLDALFSGIDLTGRPVIRALVESGVRGLYDLARRRIGFEEDPEGYIAKCHLCLDIRRRLVESGAEDAELAPREFYRRLQ